jgi:molybdopterin-guanine dinucleotide biosynthesis protein A
MSVQKHDMNCYILAGGKSSRMGIDKGLIILNKKTIVEHVIHVLKPLFKNLIIVSNNPDYSKFGLEVITDLVKDSGPAGGIYTALNHTNTRHNFIVSCDMPFITSQAVEFVIHDSKDHEITVPVYKQKYEPLFAVYSKSCAEGWKKQMDKGVFKLQLIMNNFKTRELNVDGNTLFNDDLFININTKEDLETAKRQLTQKDH